MRPQPKLSIWLAIAFLFIGLACNPISSSTALTANPTDTPQQTLSPHIAVFPPAAAGSQATLPSRLSASPTLPSTTFTERTVHVDALNVREGPPASGGTNAVEVRVRPVSSSGDLHVGFIETGVGAIGAQWHASGWVAVLIASMMLGVDPTNYEFDFTNEGYIDGPSAGCLMTVAVLAALRGDTPRPDATMTGTINPDGTVGPVGGIPHKLHGAADKGKKLVLVPIGQRFDEDLNTTQMVDVVAEGQSLGMDVREVGNVYDAYALIVGRPLPRPTVSPTAPQFPVRTVDRIKTKLGEWYNRYDQERTQYDNFAAPIKQHLANDVQTANAVATKSINDLNQGLVGLAYFEITEATSLMHRANVEGQIIQRYASGGFNAAVSYLQMVANVESDLDAAVNQLQLQQPKAVSDLVGLFDAYSNLGGAEGLLVGVRDRISTLKGNLSKLSKEETLQQLMNIGEDMASASNYIQIALDSADFETGVGSTPLPSAAQVAGVADTLSQAGDANLALFESTIIAPTAQQLQTTNDDMKNRLLSKDDDYRVAVLSGIGEGVLYGKMGSGIQKSAMVFGNAQNIYAYSSSLIAKYYSLGAKMDKNLRVTSYQNEKALGEMLNFADQRAKELISLCGSEVPIPAILYYENAHALRQGSASDQLTALNYYWQAVALAQADAFMSGKFSSK